MPSKYTNYKNLGSYVLFFVVITISSHCLASPTFNLKKELIETVFFPGFKERNPMINQFQARVVYGNQVNYFIDESSGNIRIEHNGRSYQFQTTQILEQTFSNWSQLGIRYNRVYSRSDADFIFERSVHDRLANAIAFPPGYYFQNSFSEQGLLQVHPNQIANTLHNLNGVDRSHIFHRDDHELIESILTYITTHELGHILGFAHPGRYLSGCEEVLTNQAPIMSNLQDYFRIQYHLNGDIPVHQQQIGPSEREIRDFNKLNANIASQKKRDVSSTKLSCNATKVIFISKILAVFS